MEKEKETYHCDVCGKEIDWNDVLWVNSSFGVCDECLEKIPRAIHQKISDDILDVEVELWVRKNCHDGYVDNKPFLDSHKNEPLLFFFKVGDNYRENIERGNLSREELAKLSCHIIALSEFDTDWNDTDDNATYIPDPMSTWCYVSMP